MVSRIDVTNSVWVIWNDKELKRHRTSKLKNGRVKPSVYARRGKTKMS